MCIPSSLIDNGSVKKVTAATNTHNNRRIVGCVVFHEVCVLSRKVCDYFFPDLLDCFEISEVSSV
jgi:hypothetical protein